STDRTPELLRESCRQRPWLRTLRHPRNLGLGSALRTAFAGELAPVICTIDSDCTYPPERLPELISLLEQGADLVTGSPWHPDNTEFEGASLRLFLSRAVSRAYRWITGTQIHTFTSLFRAYRRELVRQVSFHENGFAATAEILVRAVLQGFRVVEQPMPLATRRRGASKLRLLPSVSAHLRLLLATARWVWAHRRRKLGSLI
ncbi:MAG: glycosyltransferase family 2 protein, partial [Bryobacteraceae bacterium]|nr:glycosyltransferase family 2 protein [Bryobacteraceae bacterium]